MLLSGTLAAGARARVALTGLTVAEYFRDQMGQDVLFFVDNIFRFTQVWTYLCLQARRGWQVVLLDAPAMVRAWSEAIPAVLRCSPCLVPRRLQAVRY